MHVWHLQTRKTTSKTQEDMQNQRFHAVCKNDIPQPTKHLKIYIFCPKYVPKSHPKLLRISAFDVVTCWITFWLRLGSFFAPGLAPKGPPSSPKRLQEAPRDCHGEHQVTPRRLQGLPQCHFGLILVGGSLVVPRISP